MREKTRVDTRDMKREATQEIAEGTSSAFRLANSLAASFPGRNERRMEGERSQFCYPSKRGE